MNYNNPRGDIYMKLSDGFDVRDLLLPRIYYSGDWFVSRDPYAMEDHLLLNAKVENGKNKYEEFLEKQYYQPMRDIVKSEEVSRKLKPLLVSSPSYDGTGRALYFSYVYMCCSSIGGYNISEKEKFITMLQKIEDYSESMMILKGFFREERRIISEIIKRGKEAPCYEENFASYQRHSNGNASIGQFNMFLEKRKEKLTDFIVGINHLEKIFKKELDVDAFIDCFDYDKLSLCIAVSLLESCLFIEEKHNTLETAACYLYKYVQVVEYIRKTNPSYDCTIVDKDENGNLKTISCDDVIKQLRSLLVRHPDAQIYEITAEEAYEMIRPFAGTEEVDLSVKGIHILLDKAFKDKEEKINLGASWVMVPEGESEPRSMGLGLGGREGLELEEKRRRMLFSKFFFENSSPLYVLKGINNFAGYIAYIYSSKKVAFEQFYEDEAQTKIASSKATYVMNLYNFISLSKLTKPEIIQIINARTEYVKRFHHGYDMDKWQERVVGEIQGDDHTQEVTDHIESLLGKKVINKVKQIS